jgi:hypothetical protein
MFIEPPFHHFTNIYWHDLKVYKRSLDLQMRLVFGALPWEKEMNQLPIFRSNIATHVVWFGQSSLFNDWILFPSKICSSFSKRPRSHLLTEYSGGIEWLSLQREIHRATYRAATTIISSIRSQEQCKCDFSYPGTSHSKHVRASILQSCLVMQRIQYEKAWLGSWDFHGGGRSKVRRER